MLENKKILFISPKFFDYEKEIKSKLEELGAEVDFFDERPSNKSLTKALIRVNRKILYKSIQSHYSRIYDKVSKRLYDYLFLIKGEATPAWFLEKLRVKWKDTKFVYYTYDSFKNNKNAINNLSYFDKKFSFDDIDVLKYEGLLFRPLFYLDSYKTSLKENYEYLLSFIGTVHSDRYDFVTNVTHQLLQKNHNDKAFLYFYCQSEWYYYIRKLFDKNFRKIEKEKLCFCTLGKDKVIDIFQKSKSVIDIQHPQQTGLTMRTIEAIGAQKKIITTNDNIRKYDFYCSENILIVDRRQPIVDVDFFDIPYKSLPTEVYERYSLLSWIKEILF